MKMTPVHSPARNAQRSGHQVLDPCTLGRPIHLLNAFTSAFAADLGAFFTTQFNRRYGASFELGAVSLTRGGPVDSASSRWLVHANDIGRIGFAAERCLLLAVLACRYGEPGGKAPARIEESVRQTTTEERLAHTLALRLSQLVASRVEACGEPGTGDKSAAGGFARSVPVRATAGTWTVRAEVREAGMEIDGLLWFTLDDAWMARLLRRLAPTRERPVEGTRRAAPLPTRLQLTLTARLSQKEMPLGELMDLRVGAVIPISLGATDVLVDDSKLFTGSIAEHKGKLCLTSLDYVD